jgi:hypothetical protein
MVRCQSGVCSTFPEFFTNALTFVFYGLVFWFNVGLPHKELLIGRVISLGATAVTIVFWTVPMAFLTTLSSVESLKEQYDWVADLTEEFPFTETILQLLAPLLLILINSVVYVAYGTLDCSP